MSKFKKGATVKLSDDLSKSIKQFGGRYPKIKIQGTYQKVYRTRSDSFVVRANGGSWTILDCDAEIPDPIKIDPELFNTDNLFKVS